MLRIRDVYPGSRIRLFSIPDPNCLNPGSLILIKEFKYLIHKKNQKMVSKLQKIWSGLFIPDPGSGCWLSTHPGSRIPDPGVIKAPDPGSATLFKRIKWIIPSFVPILLVARPLFRILGSKSGRAGNFYALQTSHSKYITLFLYYFSGEQDRLLRVQQLGWREVSRSLELDLSPGNCNCYPAFHYCRPPCCSGLLIFLTIAALAVRRSSHSPTSHPHSATSHCIAIKQYTKKKEPFLPLKFVMP